MHSCSYAASSGHRALEQKMLNNHVACMCMPCHFYSVCLRCQYSYLNRYSQAKLDLDISIKICGFIPPPCIRGLCHVPATRPPVSIKLNYPQLSSPARWHFVRPCYIHIVTPPPAPSTWQCRCFVRRQSLRSVWAWDSWAAIMFIHDLCKYPQQQQPSCSGDWG